MVDKHDLLLIKHFMGETTPDEELKIAKYKQDNEAEYKALRKFWMSEGKIKPINFDTQKAFDKVKNKVRNQKKAKVVSIFGNAKILMVAASVTLIMSIGVFWLMQKSAVNQSVIVADAMLEGGKVVNLPDGTIITLNKNATIRYDKKFADKQRTVSLTGEAFFEVAKDKTRPFVVKMPKTEVTVLGTSFNINCSNQQTEVTVATGRVRVMASELNKSVEITPGQSAKLTNSKLTMFETDNKNYLAWKTGEFTFSNTPIKQVIAELNKYYDNKIVSINDTTCVITTNFNKKPLDEVIEILELTCNIKLKSKK